MAYKRSRTDFEDDLPRQSTHFVFYGTPLPTLDDHARDDGSYVPVWKQEVTDDRGRKRLHGAFTGGFSAGYFNTVGSKEGWAPATFVSSRANRIKGTENRTQQRPEDFMDEEDIREQEESRNLVATSDFAGFGTEHDSYHKNALMDLLRSDNDSMGTKLLNKMGWKHGHGIGPKVKRRAEADNESSKIHLFAPDDVPMLLLNKRVGHTGLGYTGGDGAGSLTAKSAISYRARPFVKPGEEEEDGDENNARPGLDFASRTKKASKQKRAAFGVGILNDTGSDDEDPYSMGPKISYNKTLGADRKPKKTKAALSSNANPLLKNTPIFVSKKLSSISSTLRKCHDGRLSLDGFVLADESDDFSPVTRNYENCKPPAVPADWKPAKALSTEPNAEQSTYQSTADMIKSNSVHTSSTRGNLLGESALPGKSVFDYLTPAAREKLMKATGKQNLPPALGESLPGTTSASSAVQSLDVDIPRLDPQAALQALTRLLTGGFSPYASEPAKAARYKSYLESQANTNTNNNPSINFAPMPSKPNTTSHQNHIQELQEFARVAEVFKPVSGLIASRFTTSTATSVDPAAAATSSPTSLLTHAQSRPQSPSTQAASLGMFGPLTRSTSNFHPNRLLCKRFGVPVPDHADISKNSNTYSKGRGSEAEHAWFQNQDQSQTQSPRTEAEHHHVNQDRPTQRQTGTNIESNADDRSTNSGQAQAQAQLRIEAPPPSSVYGSDGTTSTHDHGTVIAIDPDKNEALEQEKPGAAVFRAIFGSDDSDSE